MAVNLGEIQARLTLDKGDFDKNMKKSKRTMKTVAGAAAALGAAAAGAAVALGTKAVAASADFESAITEAGIKVQSTSEQLEKMESAAISAGQASKFTATESAQAMTFLGQAGFDAAQQIEALPSVLELASAENMNVAQTADIASNIMQGFGKEASEVNEIADLLVKTSQSANTNVQELGQAMSFAAPAARSAGISMSETAAAVGALSSSGIKAGRAGRALRKIMSKLQPVSDELGASLSRGEIASKGLAASLQELQEHGLNAGNAMDHFGARHGTTVQAILQQGIPAFKDLTKEVEDNADAAGDAADKQLDTLSGKYEQLKGSINVAAIAMGDELNPIMKDVTDTLRAQADAVSSADSSWSQFFTETIRGAQASIVATTTSFSELIGLVESGRTEAFLEGLQNQAELRAEAQELRRKGALNKPPSETNVGDLSAARSRLNMSKARAKASDRKRGAFEAESPGLAATRPGLTGAPGQATKIENAGTIFQKSVQKQVKSTEEVRRNLDSLKKSVRKNTEAQKRQREALIQEINQGKNTARAVKARKRLMGKGSGVAGGIIAGAKQTAQQKGQAGRQQFRSMMNQVAASPTFKTMKEAGKTLLVASDKLNEAGSAQKQTSETTQQGLRTAIGQAQSAFSMASGLANAIAGASGGGKTTRGITGALSKGLGGAATGAALGGPVGAAVGGGVGLLTGAISAFGGGQTADQQKKAQQRRERRRMIEKQADRIAERMGEEMEERQLQARVIQIDASGALMGSEREQAQALGDLLENEVGRREGLNL